MLGYLQPIKFPQILSSLGAGIAGNCWYHCHFVLCMGQSLAFVLVRYQRSGVFVYACMYDLKQLLLMAPLSALL
jgi:hypothetical protein